MRPSFFSNYPTIRVKQDGIAKRIINPKLIEIKAIIHINTCIPLSAALDASLAIIIGPPISEELLSPKIISFI